VTELAPHFSWAEAFCRCTEGGRCPAYRPIADIRDTAARLERLRTGLGAPIRITSWFRCKYHSVEARKGRNALHRHCTGRAVDIAVEGTQALKVIELARWSGFRSVGVYRWGLHLDWVDGNVARYWLGS